MINKLQRALLCFAVSFAAIAVAQSTHAAAAIRVDAKKSLNLSEGDYVVTSADSAVAKENFCVKGLVHTIVWVGAPADPTLSIGASFSYSDINDGLKTDSQPYYKNHCVYRKSIQAQTNKLISDLYTNCDDSNSTVHSELVVNGATLEFSSEMKISRAGKVFAIPSKCTLVKKVAAPAAALRAVGPRN